MFKRKEFTEEPTPISVVKDITGVNSATFIYNLLDKNPREPLINKVGLAGAFMGVEYVLPATGAFIRRLEEVQNIADSGGKVDTSYGCLSPLVGVLGDAVNITTTLGVVGLTYKFGGTSWEVLAAAAMASKLALNSIAFSLLEAARR